MNEQEIAAPSVSSEPSYIAKHWRGELPLRRSYWGNAFGVSIATRVITGAFNGVLMAMGVSSGIIAGFMIWQLVQIPIFVWMPVGVWRSAGRYTGPSIWKVLARVAVCLGVAWNTLVLLSNLVRCAQFLMGSR